MSHVELNISTKGVASVWLNRPDVHNAFDETLIAELTDMFKKLGSNPQVRVILFSGDGKSFCAGADLKWMAKMKAASKEDNLADARKLAAMFKTINEVPQPLIGKIHGSAVGGGIGLVSVCDYVIAAENTNFALSEVRLGLVPATIAPYVVAKIGESNARAFFLSGEVFNANRALQMNLIHEVVPANSLQERAQKVVESFMKAGPNAAKYAKKLVAELGRPDVVEYTAQLIAYLRASPEGQEGMSSLLNKHHPSWQNYLYDNQY